MWDGRNWGRVVRLCAQQRAAHRVHAILWRGCRRGGGGGDGVSRGICGKREQERADRDGEGDCRELVVRDRGCRRRGAERGRV